MKAWGVDVLSRGDLLEGMMAGENPLLFVSLARVSDKRYNERVGRWVRSWWKDSKGGSIGET